VDRRIEAVLAKGLGIHQWLYEKSDGRIGANLAGRPMLLLRTVGAKTGKQRTNALLYVPTSGDFTVIASTGGGPKHPGWYHNLLARPEAEVQVGRERIPVHARVAEGDERERLWAEANRINRGGYDGYQAKTERRIPVVVLERR
jgi:deazaflavin-dependent oxidoreductase (nitroreductase family)